MKKYDNSLIRNYVWGEDIIGHDIDELENDPEFMMEVIKYTKDKKIYKLCSKDVKENYNFIRFMVETFKDDKKFIKGIADDFLEMKKDFKQNLELLIIMNGLLDKEECFDYGLCLVVAETRIFSEIVGNLQFIENEAVRDTIGKGFFFIIDSYGDSKIITDYLAKKMVENIFYQTSLELFLHEKFKKFEQIEDQGINNFIVGYLSNVDSYLSSYIATNISIVSDLNKDIQRVGRNWNIYLDNLNEIRVLMVYDQVIDYIEKEKMVLDFSFQNLIIQVAKTKGVFDIFSKYDSFDEDIGNNINSNKCLFSTTSNFKCRKLYIFISELIDELFSTDIIKEDFSDYDEEPQKKGQVLAFQSIKKFN